MVLSLLPAGAAFATNHEDICSDAPEESLPSYTDDGQIATAFEDYVDCMGAYGVARGFNDGSFGPGLDVTRQQMASFIARLISQAEDGDLDFDATTPAVYTDRTDIADAHIEAVDYLSERGVVEGFNDGSYRPGVDVTRAQMASFIARAMEEVGAELPEGDGGNFTDVDDDATHSDNINKLAEAGIVRGFNDGTYRPAANVTRQQMSQFVILGAAELADQGLWNGEFIIPDDEEPAGPNEDFDLTKGAAVNNASTGAADNTGSRTYTASGLGTTPVNIALFPADDVTTDSNGQVSFTVTGTAPNEVADNIGNVPNAVIEVVQGVAVGNQKHVGDDEAPITPTNGSITFTVDSTSFDEVIPVVFVDADNDNQLDVDANGLPEEDFGVGGQKTWLPAEAADGAAPLTDELVQFVDKDANFFVANDARYNYDEGDVFRYDSNNDGTANQVITFAQWETALSVGDTVDQATPYSRNFQNEFGIDDDAIDRPTGLAATVGDFDATPSETDADDVRFTWSAPSPPNGLIANYTVTVYDDDPAVAGCQTATTVRTVSTTGTGTTVDVLELANDTYCARVVTNSIAGQSSAASSPVFFTVQVGTADETAPRIINTEIAADNGTPAEIDALDVIEIQFNETMDTALETAGRFRFTDPDGEIFEIRCAAAPALGVGEATCSLGAGDANGDGDTTDAGDANSLLTVTLVDDPVKVGGPSTTGGAVGAQVPSTITAMSAEFRDVAGNRVDLANSTDLVIDNEF